MYAALKTRQHTYSMGSAGIVSFALIIAWLSIIVVGQNMTSIHVAYESSSAYFVKVTFNAPMLQKFHSCLCSGNAAKCVAHYELAHYAVIDVTDEERVVNDQISRTYKCTNDASHASVICEQQRPQDHPDFSSRNVLSQSFLIIPSPCDSTCIVFIWQLQEENLNYADAVDAVDCGTNCACTHSATAAATITSQSVVSQRTPTPTKPKTTQATSKATITTQATAVIEISKTTKSTTSTLNVISTHVNSSTTVANLGIKTSDEDTPVGLIVGVVIGVIIVIAAIVIGIIIWRRSSAASELSEKMHHQMDTPKESSEARTLAPMSRNNMEGTLETQLSSTGNSDLEGETFAVPLKTKHQQDAVPVDVAKNGTNSTSLTLSQQYVNEKNAPNHEYANDNLVSVHMRNFKKSENNALVKEKVCGNKGKQPTRNTSDDDIGYAFSKDPLDQGKIQNLNFSFALSPQETSRSNRGSSDEDHGYAGVYEVEIFGGGNGGTDPEYENWIENTLQSKNHIHDMETKLKTNPSTVLVGNINNSHRSNGGGNYGDSYADQEFSKGSKAILVFGLFKACSSGNSGYEYPVMENEYDCVSVNSNTQINDKLDKVDTNIDDDDSTAGRECHSSSPSSDAISSSKNVNAKLHDGKREMHNPYSNFLSQKVDPEVGKLTEIPIHNTLPADQLACYSNVLPTLNAFSNRESDETMPFTDVASTEL